MTIMLKKKPYTAHDYTQSYVNGKPVFTRSDTYTVMASIQPLDESRLQIAPEGLRSSHAIVIYGTTGTNMHAYEAGATVASLIEYKGRVYLIYKKDDWSDAPFLRHRVYEAFASETARELYGGA